MTEVVALTETEWQRKVVDMARWRGWLIYHPERATVSGRWLTPGSKGFPDLVLAHAKWGVLFVELKTDKGRLSADQVDWLHTLGDGGAEVHVWRPSDWPTVVHRLDGQS